LRHRHQLQLRPGPRQAAREVWPFPGEADGSARGRADYAAARLLCGWAWYEARGLRRSATATELDRHGELASSVGAAGRVRPGDAPSGGRIAPNAPAGRITSPHRHTGLHPGAFTVSARAVVVIRSLARLAAQRQVFGSDPAEDVAGSVCSVCFCLDRGRPGWSEPSRFLTTVAPDGHTTRPGSTVRLTAEIDRGGRRGQSTCHAPAQPETVIVVRICGICGQFVAVMCHMDGARHTL